MRPPYPGFPSYPPGDPRNAAWSEKMARENAWIVRSERAFWNGLALGLTFGVVLALAILGGAA